MSALKLSQEVQKTQKTGLSHNVSPGGPEEDITGWLDCVPSQARVWVQVAGRCKLNEVCEQPSTLKRAARFLRDDWRSVDNDRHSFDAIEGCRAFELPGLPKDLDDVANELRIEGSRTFEVLRLPEDRDDEALELQIVPVAFEADQSVFGRFTTCGGRHPPPSSLRRWVQFDDQQ